MSRPAPPFTDILISGQHWQDASGCETTIRRAIDAAAAAVDVSTSGAEIAVMLTDDASIRKLNRDWRGIDKATNVLSFPAAQTVDRDSIGAPRILGDIAIAYETTRREAEAEHKPFAHHLSHLAVHGFLHLIGYDHETDEEAEQMEGLECKILAQLGVPDPYAPQNEVGFK